ncbi:MAG: hypothetical protein GWN00_24615, partial [Aliifodinibius sp.]|nr:hypothetical protein [Fodinibius sp.]NIY27872.1 hypothetical protein [Fodinibius sp.]
MNGALLMITMGGIRAQLGRATKGEELENDPSTLLAESIDRSGVLGVFANAAGLASRVSGGAVGTHLITGGEPSR